MVGYQSKIKVIICLLATVLLMAPVPSHAVTITDLNNQKKALQDAQRLKQQQLAQQQQLANQLKSEVDKLNGQISATQATINKIANDIATTNQGIADLTKQIAAEQQLLASEQAKLQDTMRNMYMDATSDSPLLSFAQTNITDSLEQQQSYQALEVEIEKKAQEIADLKTKLEQQKTDLQNKQNSLIQMKSQQVQQKQALDNQVSLKNKLLSDTIGSINQLNDVINQYSNQIRAVDGRISDLIAALAAANVTTAASGDLVVSNIQPWHYFQTDQRWASQPLDPTSSDSDTFAESGCLVTSISMVATRFGVGGTPPQVLSRLRAAGAMYGDLVAWGGIDDAFSGQLVLAAGTKEAINWGRVDASLAQGQPVIVHVNKGTYGHWVVIGGKVNDKYEVEDPYFTSGRVYPAGWIDAMARLVPSS